LSRTIRAIIKKPHEFKSVQMRVGGAGFELLSYGDNEADLSPADATVVGFDSGRAAFYRIMVPPVREDQMPNLVRMQAETLLPLPLEQMELAWRRGIEVEGGKTEVTLAAGRSIQLERFFQDVQDCAPSKIILDGEAIIKSWQVFFGGGLEYAVVIYLGETSSHVCLAHNGSLSHAVTLELGRDDLVQASSNRTNLQRFSHDLQHALQLFDIQPEKQVPLYLLCPDLQSYQDITKYLSEMDLNVQAALPNRDQLTCSSTFSAELFYAYLAPLGLALLGLDAETRELKLFQRILPEKNPQPIGLSLPSLKVSAILAAVMVFVFGGVFSWYTYVGDKNSQDTTYVINDSEIDLRDITREQNIKKAIAQDRIDLLTLIEKISGCAPRGVELDKFIYQKGRQVTVEGQTSRQEMIYSFTGNLKLQPVFKQIIIQNQNPETRGNRINFTVKFDYTEAPQ